MSPAVPEELREAMLRFQEATERLQGSYARLQDEVRELRARLEAKDRELGRSRAETEHLARYLEHLLESVPSGVVAVDAEGLIATINRAAQEITGFGPETAGRPFGEVFRFEEPEAADLEALQGKARPTLTLVRPDGERVLLGLRVSPLRGGPENRGGWVVVFQDVTRLRRLEEQEERNRRLVAMGQMAAGIAHEIRNPLGSLELFASHLVEELRGSAHEDLAAQVLKGLQNLSRITGNLLLFARQVEPRRAACDLAEVVAEAVLYARSALRAKDAVLEEQVEPAPARVDPDLVRQALLNVLLNAAQAVEAGGRVRVVCGPAPDEGPGAVRVVVEDDGPGVPPEERERIFDPFYTTRARGVGLGLAIVQRIVAAHGGWVGVDGSPWGGAAFTLVFPADAPT
ncbi:two-component system sensor histidine kinase NtrB [Deferrisoma sp.]